MVLPLVPPIRIIERETTSSGSAASDVGSGGSVSVCGQHRQDLCLRIHPMTVSLGSLLSATLSLG